MTSKNTFSVSTYYGLQIISSLIWNFDLYITALVCRTSYTLRYSYILCLYFLREVGQHHICIFIWFVLEFHRFCLLRCHSLMNLILCRWRLHHLHWPQRRSSDFLEIIIISSRGPQPTCSWKWGGEPVYIISSSIPPPPHSHHRHQYHLHQVPYRPTGGGPRRCSQRLASCLWNSAQIGPDLSWYIIIQIYWKVYIVTIIWRLGVSSTVGFHYPW